MVDSSPIRVFVGHLFERDVDYLRVFEYLESIDNFSYVNTSNPDAIPAGGKEALKDTLLAQLKAAEVLVLPIPLYARNRELVTFLMDAAAAHSLPIIAVKSFGETVALPRAIMERCADMVDWNARAIVDAIRRHARHENTSRWETIEFTPD